MRVLCVLEKEDLPDYLVGRAMLKTEVENVIAVKPFFTAGETLPP